MDKQKFTVGEEVIYCGKLSKVAQYRGFNHAIKKHTYDVRYDNGLSLMSRSCFVREDLLRSLY